MCTCTSAIVVDGLLDAEYGEPLALQTLKSSARTNNITQQIVAVYSRVETNPAKWYLFVAGNVDKGTVKLHVFIEGPSGERTLTSRNYDGGRARNLAGLTFDFAVQFHLFARVQGDGTYAATFIDRSNTTTGGPTDIGVPVANGRTMGAGMVAGTTTGLFAVDNNITPTGGIGFNATGKELANSTIARAVDSGWEFEFTPVQVAGKVLVILGGELHDLMYNQFLPPLPVEEAKATLNSTTLDMSKIAGDQFFLIPLPATPSSTTPTNRVTVTQKTTTPNPTSSSVTTSTPASVSTTATTLPSSTTPMTRDTLSPSVTATLLSMMTNASSPQPATDAQMAENVVPIAAGVGGGVAALLLIGLVVFFVCRARRRGDKAVAPQGREMQRNNQYDLVPRQAGEYDVGDVEKLPAPEYGVLSIGGIQVKQTGVGTEYGGL